MNNQIIYKIYNQNEYLHIIKTMILLPHRNKEADATNIDFNIWMLPTSIKIAQTLKSALCN